MSTTHDTSRAVNNPILRETIPSLAPHDAKRHPGLTFPAGPPARRRRQGFTLIEILAVLTLVAVLMSLTANVANDVVEANQISQAGEMVSDELKLARHTAQVRDRVVEVRFYKSTAPNSFGESPGVSAVQAFIFDQDNAEARPVREVRRLPSAVKISEDATLSTLITDARIKTDWKEGDEQKPLPDAGTDYTAYRVRFLPDGSTDLDAQQEWFLTVHSRNARQSPPANYVTVQVKPTRGTVRSFTP
ncbi:uncharacterized protein (TIGR02596 family) [Prosthecobacter fusiformis]|uniref:Uncharacterized protein (TIGR02596 family) n=1 Tax=Prosthecobacter fusiformis TaxID=48464 RepID=A0A4R7RQ36_9BACT|nr:Verru_Chthon cassette protein D [Prosthecobacter fusiformis]TDU67199.1 uncharacterized protein (TIGR02596 family) [Prosthecobacter fusiformis]